MAYGDWQKILQEYHEILKHPTNLVAKQQATAMLQLIPQIQSLLVYEEFTPMTSLSALVLSVKPHFHRVSIFYWQEKYHVQLYHSYYGIEQEIAVTQVVDVIAPLKMYVAKLKNAPARNAPPRKGAGFIQLHAPNLPNIAKNIYETLVYISDIYPNFSGWFDSMKRPKGTRLSFAPPSALRALLNNWEDTAQGITHILHCQASSEAISSYLYLNIRAKTLHPHADFIAFHHLDMLSSETQESLLLKLIDLWQPQYAFLMSPDFEQHQLAHGNLLHPVGNINYIKQQASTPPISSSVEPYSKGYLVRYLGEDIESFIQQIRQLQV